MLPHNLGVFIAKLKKTTKNSLKLGLAGHIDTKKQQY